MLASRGYAVFAPNIRGSSGYGQTFLGANKADWGGGDFKDAMAGVDDLVAARSPIPIGWPSEAGPMADTWPNGP